MIRKILTFPDKMLAIKCDTVNFYDRDLVEDLLDTVKAAKGIGLAANQIGVHQRVFVLSIPAEGPQTFYNPTFTELTKDCKKDMVGTEGCLSYPTIFINVPRFSAIQAAWDEWDGHKFNRKTRTMNGLEARAFQHECEHLDGHNFVFWTDDTTKKRVRNKMDKWTRKGWIWPTGAGTRVTKVAGG